MNFLEGRVDYGALLPGVVGIMFSFAEDIHMLHSLPHSLKRMKYYSLA